jgi:hypothetical protein
MQASQANIEMECRLNDYSVTLIAIKSLHKKAHLAMLNKRYGEALMCAAGIEANARVLREYVANATEQTAKFNTMGEDC